MKEDKISWFYKLHQAMHWSIYNYYEDNQEITVEEINWKYDLSLDIEGIADSTSQNSWYPELIRSLDIKQITIANAMESICEFINLDDYPRIPLDTIIPTSQMRNSENLDKDSTIIWSVLFHKFSISRVWNDFNVSSWYVRKLIKEFNKNIRLVRRDN